jgi:hypothetical protein
MFGVQVILPETTNWKQIKGLVYFAPSLLFCTKINF